MPRIPRPDNPYREVTIGVQHTDDPDTCPYSDDRHRCEVCIAVAAFERGVEAGWWWCDDSQDYG